MKTTCCLIRRKVVIAITAVLPEAVCGVPDSELADVLDFSGEFAKPTSGKPVLGFRFCPWCGKRREPGDEARVTDVTIQPNPDPRNP